MSNYFDNQDKWSWQISDKEVLVTTDHGDHTHTMDVTNVPIGEMVDHMGQVMGDAHRAASHDFNRHYDKRYFLVERILHRKERPSEWVFRGSATA